METKGTAAQLPARRPDVWVRRADHETVLVTARGVAHVVNDTALAIWELCDGETSPQEMIDAVCALCRVVYDMAAEDVQRVLSELDTAELIQWH